MAETRTHCEMFTIASCVSFTLDSLLITTSSEYDILTNVQLSLSYNNPDAILKDRSSQEQLLVAPVLLIKAVDVVSLRTQPLCTATSGAASGGGRSISLLHLLFTTIHYSTLFKIMSYFPSLEEIDEGQTEVRTIDDGANGGDVIDFGVPDTEADFVAREKAVLGDSDAAALTTDGGDLLSGDEPGFINGSETSHPFAASSEVRRFETVLEHVCSCN